VLISASGQLPAVLQHEQSVIPLVAFGEETPEFEQRPGRRIVSHGREKVVAGEQKIGGGLRFGGETKEPPGDEIRNRRAASNRDHTCSPVGREASGEARECDNLTISEIFAILPELRGLSTRTANRRRRLKGLAGRVTMPVTHPRDSLEAGLRKQPHG
jgi:hypothetical protein